MQFTHHNNKCGIPSDQILRSDSSRANKDGALRSLVQSDRGIFESGILLLWVSRVRASSSVYRDTITTSTTGDESGEQRGVKVLLLRVDASVHAYDRPWGDIERL